MQGALSPHQVSTKGDNSHQSALRDLSRAAVPGVETMDIDHSSDLGRIWAALTNCVRLRTLLKQLLEYTLDVAPCTILGRSLGGRSLFRLSHSRAGAFTCIHRRILPLSPGEMWTRSRRAFLLIYHSSLPDQAICRRNHVLNHDCGVQKFHPRDRLVWARSTTKQCSVLVLSDRMTADCLHLRGVQASPGASNRRGKLVWRRLRYRKQI